MITAIPVFGSRIAPRFSHADAFVLARVAAGQATPLEQLDTTSMTEDERIALLERRNVALVACGGIDRELMRELEERGIQVIYNVAGETDHILRCLAQGHLQPGYGLSRDSGGHVSTSSKGESRAANKEPPGETRTAIDCIRCSDRSCLRGQVCPRNKERAPPTAPTRSLRQLEEVTGDIAAEPERVLCRVAELVYFALDMKYRHLGLAFCADLFDEAEIVTELLRRFFHVTPVCCKLGGILDVEEMIPVVDRGPRCNPLAQARALNEAGTNLNVIMGLCMGADVIVAERSLAPSTVLVVKDRLLAHNPVAAVHSRYVLQNILGRT